MHTCGHLVTGNDICTTLNYFLMNEWHANFVYPIYMLDIKPYVY